MSLLLRGSHSRGTQYEQVVKHDGNNEHNAASYCCAIDDDKGG